MILSLEIATDPYGIASFGRDIIGANDIALYFGQSGGSSTSLETIRAYFGFNADFDTMDDGVISFTAEIYSIDASYTIGTVPTSTTLLLSYDHTYTSDVRLSGADHEYENGITCEAGDHGLYLKVSNISNTTGATLAFSVSSYTYIH